MNIPNPAYFDNAASTPVSRRAMNAVNVIMSDIFGNPSAGHLPGRLADEQLKKARKSVAEVLNVSDRDIIFTSGGTESNSLAIFGAVKRAGLRAVTFNGSHPSVISPFRELKIRGADILFLTPGQDGSVSPGDLTSAITEKTALISLSHVNHETGVLLDIESLVRTVKLCKNDVLVHVDAVQGFGKLPIDALKWNADLISISAHKIHGLSGTGALYIRQGLTGAVKPLIYGGGQERGIRPGTENLAGIAAFGAAAEDAVLRMQTDYTHVLSLKERLLRIPSEIEHTFVNGAADEKNSSPYILNISFVGVKSEILMNALDARGIYVSAGAACNTGPKNKEPENVVYAYGLGVPRAESAIRISLSRFNTAEDVDRLVEALADIVPKLIKR